VKYTILIGLAVVALGVVPQGTAVAVERLSATELASHCDHVVTSPESDDGIFCIRYIQGFIDGAVITDERVTMNVASEYDKDETFSDRALRVRLGLSKRLASYGSYYADFCLGDPVPLAEVVQKIVADLERRKPVSETLLARDIVYSTLRNQYPCTPPPPE